MNVFSILTVFVFAGDLMMRGQIADVQFGVVMILNLDTGLITTPVGPVLSVACAVGKVSMWEDHQDRLPFYAATFLVLMIVTYVPAVSLWLPRLLH